MVECAVKLHSKCLTIRNCVGNTILIECCIKGDVKTASMLLDNGADVNFKSEFCGISKTPIYVACENNRRDIVQLLLNCGQKVDLTQSPNTSKETCLHVACEN